MPASAGMTVARSVIPANAGISLIVKIPNPPISEVLHWQMHYLTHAFMIIEVKLIKIFVTDHRSSNESQNNYSENRILKGKTI